MGGPTGSRPASPWGHLSARSSYILEDTLSPLSRHVDASSTKAFGQNRNMQSSSGVWSGAGQLRFGAAMSRHGETVPTKSKLGSKRCDC